MGAGAHERSYVPAVHFICAFRAVLGLLRLVAGTRPRYVVAKSNREIGATSSITFTCRLDSANVPVCGSVINAAVKGSFPARWVMKPPCATIGLSMPWFVFTLASVRVKACALFFLQSPSCPDILLCTPKAVDSPDVYSDSKSASRFGGVWKQ